MKMLMKTAMVLMVLGVAGMAQATTVLVIDDFDVIMTPVPSPNSSGVTATGSGWAMQPTLSTSPYLETGLDTAHVIGGSRLITVLPSADTGTTATMNTTLGKLSVNNEDGFTSLLNLLYNANSAGLSADLSAGEWIRLVGSLEHVDNGSSLGFTLVDADGTSASNVIYGFPTQTQTFDFDFDDFNIDVGGGTVGLDLEHIASIQLTYQGDLSNDFNSVEGLTVERVPEPISMMMLGCLGAGMAVARKLRRKA